MIFLMLMVLIMCRVRQYWRKYILVRFPKQSLTAVYPQMQTGDLIYFLPHAHGFVNSLITTTIFTHVGVVVFINGRPYISEVGFSTYYMPLLDPDCPQTELVLPSYAAPWPLLTRLKYYAGDTFWARPKVAFDPKSITKITTLASNTGAKYPALWQLVGRIFGLGGDVMAPDTPRHCAEHVLFLLYQAECIPRPKKGLAAIRQVFNFDLYHTPVQIY